MIRFVITAAFVLILSVANTHADEQPSDIPKPIPATRPEMKAALEALKDRQPRLPLPDAGGQGGVNNGRMRSTYLPESWGSGGRRSGRSTNRQGRRDRLSGFGRRGQDPNSTMDYTFTTSLFWIVSRGNNCYYCLGHQELKLRGAGLDDDTIASLDSDWSRFDPRQQAALGYAQKLTLEPQLVGDAEIAALKQLFTDAEIIELTFNVARFNATNRWTDGMGLPQDRRFGDRENTLTTPTSKAFQHTASIVSPDTRAERPKPPTMVEVNSVLSSLSKLTARVQLPSEEEARKALSEVIGDRPPFDWERAMAAVQGAGPSQVATLNTIMNDEHLPLRLKAELSLITAANNRAWYSLGHAIDRLHALGVTNDEIAALLNPPAGSPNPAYRLAAKSSSDPHLITDVDIASVRDKYGDSETAQIMHVICMSNMFDRFTQALGLPLEESIIEYTTAVQP